MWGEITQQYEVFCALCYRPHGGTYFAIAPNLTIARDELVASGWKKSKGRWRCQKCAIKPDPAPGQAHSDRRG